MIRVLLADDHQIITDGLRSILEKEPEIEVVAVACNGVEVLKKLKELPVDVVILDIAMPEMDGIETTRCIKESYPQVKVLILSMYKNKEYVQRVLKQGAKGYILKEKSKEALVGAIYTVYRGGEYISLELARKVLFDEEDEKMPIHLTEKEEVVLQLLYEGLTAREIGLQLDNEESTIQAHTRNLRRKFEVTNVVQLIRKALKEGYLKL